MYSSERFKKIIAKKMFQMTNFNSVRLQLYFNNCTIKNFVTLDLNLSSTFSFLAVFFFFFFNITPLFSVGYIF